MDIRSIVKGFFRKTALGKRQYVKRTGFVSMEEIHRITEDAPVLLLSEKTDVKVGIVRETSSNAEYINPTSSWPRYERFCKNNKIQYGFIDILRSDWMEQVAKYDVIIWHTKTNPAYKNMTESKVYVIEKVMGKLIFPSFHEAWQYESKIRASYLYKYYGIPSIPTFVTNSKEEALQKVEESEYPLIYKMSTGAGSKGVSKLDSKEIAKDKIKRIFGKGDSTYWPYFYTKDEVYLQEFIDDATFDLRVMMVDDMAFGYYRYPKKGDFKASGSHIVEKKAIPEEALKLAYKVKNALGARQMGVDMLYSEKHNQYYIIETSTFNQIDTPEQLVIDGVPGYYDMTDVNNIKFREGRFWIEELTLKSLVEEWTAKNKRVGNN